MKILTWEYRAKEISMPGSINDLTEKLNQAGESGWELVGFFDTPYSTHKVIIFKRPKSLK